MATFTGTAASEYITPTAFSGTVSANPAGSRPGSAADLIYGAGGEDYLDGSGGNDTVYAGSGNDFVLGGDGNDYLSDFDPVSNGGDDTMDGGSGNDTLYGYTGSDSLLGGIGVDVLYGESGDDTLDGGQGADIMYGGSGSDTYYVDDLGDVVSEDYSYGYDTVYSSVNFTLSNHVETLRLTGTSGLSGTGSSQYDRIYGNSGSNVLSGLAGNDALYGGGGADSLVGGDGNDTLSGDAGADTLVGGAGDDYYYVDASDTIVEASNGGTDTVYATVSITLAAQVENLTLGGNVTGTGNGSANYMHANGYSGVLNGLGGNDTLVGGWGRATLAGGAGDDYYIVGIDRQVVRENANEGIDTVEVIFEHPYYYDENVYVIPENVENAIIQDHQHYYGWYYNYYYDSVVIGNASANTVQGGEGGNLIQGLGGADTLYGRGGNDTLDGGGGTDRLDGGGGDDTVLYTTNTTTVRVDLAVGQATFPGQSFPAETLVSIERAETGTGNDIFIGNAEANLFRGNNGNDSAQGGGGADQLYGGSGSDTLKGDGGADYLYGEAGNDVLDGGGATDYMDGGGGVDTVLYTANTTSVNINLANGSVSFPGTSFPSESFSSIENAHTGSAADTLTGSSVANELRGMAGADRLIGGGAADRLVGGLGNDTFVFAGGDSVPAGRDTLLGGDGAVAFERPGAQAGDRIDLSAIDANANMAGDQAFAFGTATGIGRLWVVNAGNQTVVRGNVNGNAAAEFELVIDDGAVTANQYTAADFIL